MGVSPQHEEPQNAKSHKIAVATMFLFRRVTCRSETLPPEQNHQPTKREDTVNRDATTPKTIAATKDVPDPPAEMGRTSFSDIPADVTVDTCADDDISLVSVDRALRDMAVSDRPLTPIPSAKWRSNRPKSICTSDSFLLPSDDSPMCPNLEGSGDEERRRKMKLRPRDFTERTPQIAEASLESDSTPQLLEDDEDYYDIDDCSLSSSFGSIYEVEDFAIQDEEKQQRGTPPDPPGRRRCRSRRIMI